MLAKKMWLGVISHSACLFVGAGVGYIAFVYFGQTNGTELELKNECEQQITDVVLTYRGGVCNVDKVLGKSFCSLIIHPTAETGLGIQFRDANGTVRGDYLDTYVDNHTGGIVLEVDKNYKVKRAL
jgi:hypothetical protein